MTPKSGFGAGFGSLAVPMMALAVSVPQAAAILMPVLLLMDVLGMAAFRKDFDGDLGLYRFHRSRGWAARERPHDSDAAVTYSFHGHHGVFLFCHQPREVAALCLVVRFTKPLT